MSSAEDAVSFNNLGVTMLLAGQDQQAASSFRSSLSAIQSLLQGDRIPSVDCASKHQSLPCKADEGTNSLAYSMVPLRSLQDPYFFIFNQLIKIPTWNEHDGGSIEGQAQGCQLTTMHTAFVIMNLAVAYHRLGLTRGGAASVNFLRKAEVLYGNVDKILSGCQSSSNCMALFVRIAAMNNRSQIFICRNEWNSAKVCLELVACLLKSDTAIKSIRAASILDAMSGFLSNVMILKPPETAAAA